LKGIPMCKLCNNYRPPVTGIKDQKNIRESTFEFRKIVNEYIGTNPCSSATQLYNYSLKNKKRIYDVDEYIVRFLFRNYIKTKKDSQKLSSLRSQIDNGKIKKASNLYYTQTTVGEAIVKKVLKTKGTTVYKTNSAVIKSKTFNTLSEAQDYLYSERNKIPPKSPRKDNTIRKSIEYMISSSFSNKTSLLVYRVEYRTKKGTKTLKSFNTLEEAQQFKQGILNGNNTLVA
jgi:hypothetical protein